MTHVLTVETVIPGVGPKAIGTDVSSADFCDGTWQWLLRQGHIKSMAEIIAEADAATGFEASRNTDTLTRVTALLSTEGKMRKKAIGQKLSLSLQDLTGVLTPANGITESGGFYEV